MATQLKTFEFGQGFTDAKYEWAVWLDGKIYQCTATEDFTCKPQNFAAQVRAAAKRAGKAVRVSVDTKGGTVTFQAYEEAPSTARQVENMPGEEAPAKPAKRSRKK